MELTNKQVFDYFSQSAESFDEAKRKAADESSNKTKYFKLASDGTVAVRVMPIAPTIDADGNVSMPRKGYEYPTKELVLKIENTKAKDKKNKIIFVSLCNAKLAYPALTADLIDAYVSVACDLYADDEALVKKLKESSFNGGMKWDSKRCMYVLDIDKRNDGLQILKLSYSQYKDLEERKLKMWEKLRKSNPNAQCPISSISSAYPLEITGKTENKKTSYSFNIDNLSPVDELTEEELKLLLDAPRLPEVLYRYNRYHLEATIVYLNQMDAKFNIEVMKDQEIQNIIDQIKMVLPADDTSHFSMDEPKSNQDNGDILSIDKLWDEYDRLKKEKLDDRSEEGANLRADIKDFIEENGLDIKVSRGISNYDLLCNIEDAMTGNSQPNDNDKQTGEEEEEDNGNAEKAEEGEEEKPIVRRRSSMTPVTTEEPTPARREDRPRRRR